MQNYGGLQRLRKIGQWPIYVRKGLIELIETSEYT